MPESRLERTRRSYRTPLENYYAEGATLRNILELIMAHKRTPDYTVTVRPVEGQPGIYIGTLPAAATDRLGDVLVETQVSES